MNGRRNFLRQLCSLPLLGGGIALLGTPTAVAVKPTPEQLKRYVAWLAHEHAAALAELFCPERIYPGAHILGAWERTYRTLPLWWFPDSPEIERLVVETRPSTRAALVLSAVDGRA